MLQALGIGPASQTRRGRGFHDGELDGSLEHGEGWKQERGQGIHISALPSHQPPSPIPDGNWKAKVCSKVKKLIVLQGVGLWRCWQGRVQPLIL